MQINPSDLNGQGQRFFLLAIVCLSLSSHLFKHAFAIKHDPRSVSEDYTTSVLDRQSRANGLGSCSNKGRVVYVVVDLGVLENLDLERVRKQRLHSTRLLDTRIRTDLKDLFSI